MVNKGDSGLWRQSNGFAFVEPVVHSEDSLCSAGELSGLKSSSCGKFCNQFNGLSMAETDIPPPDGKSIPDEPIVNVNVSSIKTTNIAADSGVICLYRCCAECLYTLHSLMQKILIREWEVNGTYWTVEDVHDVVASLSVDLLSAVRKNYAAESFGNLFDKKMRQENHGKLSECQEMSICQCKNSGNRDGVLVPIDLDKDVSFHSWVGLCLGNIWLSLRNLGVELPLRDSSKAFDSLGRNLHLCFMAVIMHSWKVRRSPNDADMKCNNRASWGVNTSFEEGSEVHGDGEKVVQENGDDSRGFGPGGSPSTWGTHECDFVASLNKLVGEMEELSHMAKGKPWEHDYLKFWGLGHGPVFSL
ncbi:hypothetical protein CK203_089275 [Vitis vinifera]|uniref:Uncharacterized protein n=1 Tax=Vitis vinifera TaxID=29760 RepID=A0A438BSW2_VITVI|nr:hypothetical protein CK203_089275 [Vitis vinifera]